MAQSRDEFLSSLGGEQGAPQSRDDFLASLGPASEAPGPLSSFSGSALQGLSSLAGFFRLGSEGLAALPSFRGMGAVAPAFEATEEALAGAAEDVYPPEQRGQGGLLTEDVPAALGSVAAALPGIAAGGAGAIITFGAQNGVPLYYDVLESTGDEEAATWGLLFGGAVGQLERFGAEKYLSGIVSKLSKGTLGQALKHAALGWAIGGPSEAATEAAQQALSDLAFEQLTDEDVSNWERVKAVVPPALLVGGAFGAVASALDQRSRGQPQAAQEAGEVPRAGPLEASRQKGGVAPGAQLAPEDQQPVQSTEPAPVAPVEPQEAPAPEQEVGSAPGPEVVTAAETQEVRATVPSPEPSAAVEEAAGGQIQEDVAASAPEEAGVESAAEETVPEPEADATGIKNRTVERELEKMGVELPEKGKRGSFVDLHAKAKQTLEQDPRAGERLVSELATEERQHTDEEGALLTLEANRLRLERKAAEEAYIQDPSEANQARIDKARADFAKLADVAQETGGKVGAALNIRKMMVKEDYSLAGMERAMAVAKGGELTKAELARVKELQEKLDVLEKAHKKYVTEAELKLAEAAADKAVAGLQSKMKGLGRRSKRKAEIEQTKKELVETLDELGRHFGSKAAAGLGGLDARTLALTVKAAAKTIKLGGQTLAQWTDAMVSRFGDGIRPYLRQAWDQAWQDRNKELAEPIKARLAAGEPLSEAGNDIRKIAEGFVRHGIDEREQLISAVHAVVKDADPGVSRETVRDAISGYGEFRKLTSDAAKRRLSELKGEMREVAKLEALSQGQRPEQTGFERRKPTQQELKLNDKTRQLMRELGFTKKPGPRWNVSTINETALEARRLASAIKARRTRLAKQISSLEERIANKDFGARLKKITPVEQDPEAVKLKAQYERTKKTFELEKKKAERAKRTKAQKLLDAAKGAVNTPRSIVFSFDLPPVFRQGEFFSTSELVFAPHKLTKRVWDAILAGTSQARADRIDAKMRSGRWEDMAEIGGLDRPTMEEEMGGAPGWVQKINAPWSRIMNTYMNLQRTLYFAKLMDGVSGGKPTIADAKAAARGVNILTGRGSAKGRVASAMDALGPVLSSPRLLLSNVQKMTLQPIMTRQRAIRNQLIRAYAKNLAARAVIYGLVGLINKEDDEVRTEWDWSSSDFGKIIVGQKRYDIMGGMSQIATLTGRTLTGKTKKTTGKTVALRGEDKPFSGASVSDVWKDFTRYKLAPVASAIWDVATGEQVERGPGGKPIKPTPGSVAKNLFLPITFQDIHRDMLHQGVPKTIADRLIGAFAIGVRDYSK